MSVLLYELTVQCSALVGSTVKCTLVILLVVAAPFCLKVYEKVKMFQSVESFDILDAVITKSCRSDMLEKGKKKISQGHSM